MFFSSVEVSAHLFLLSFFVLDLGVIPSLSLLHFSFRIDGQDCTWIEIACMRMFTLLSQPCFVFSLVCMGASHCSGIGCMFGVFDLLDFLMS